MNKHMNKGINKNVNEDKYAIGMIIFKNPLYLVGACLSAWTHRKFIEKYSLNIKLLAMVDEQMIEYKNELEKYFDHIELIDLIKVKLNQKYNVIYKYSEWMKYSASKWNILKFDYFDKILFLDTDILPIDEKFYNIFNFETPAILIKGNNGKENTIIKTETFLPDIKDISNNQYHNISVELKNSLDAGIILLKPDKKIFNEYLKFLKICENSNGYISKYDSGVDETTLLLFFAFYKKVPLHLIPYKYSVIPWEKNPYDKNDVLGINFLSLIKPWVKLPFIQFAEENIWHQIAKKSLDKHSRITKIYLKFLIDELYKFYFNWKKNISKHNSPYNMESLKLNETKNFTMQLLNYLSKYNKYNLSIEQIEYIIKQSKGIHKYMNKKMLINMDKLHKVCDIDNNNKYPLARNIKKTQNNKLNCDVSFDKNFTERKNTFVDEFIINGKTKIIKKELFDKKIYELKEFLFHKKYDDKIKKSCFKKFILMPDKIIKCSDSVIYSYSKLNFDYTKNICEKLTFNEWKNHTIEICLTLYYLNNVIGIYHNDLIYKNDFRNIMMDNNKNNSIIDININLFKYSTNIEHIVLIDFGMSSPKPELRTFKFYNNKYKKKSHKYKYISEVFIMYYYFYKFYNKIEDIWDEKYDDLYISFEKDTKSLDEFDTKVINSLYKFTSSNAIDN